MSGDERPEGSEKLAEIGRRPTRLQQDREILSLFNGMDETEQGYMIEAIQRLADKSVPMETVLAETLAKLEAHRAATRARVQ